MRIVTLLRYAGVGAALCLAASSAAVIGEQTQGKVRLQRATPLPTTPAPQFPVRALLPMAVSAQPTALPPIPTLPTLDPTPSAPASASEQRRPPLVPGLLPPEAEPPPPRVDCAKAKCVALTFDDGPGTHTGKLLDMLAEQDAKATFFVVGSMVGTRQRSLLKRMTEDGHELANHSWSHRQLTRLSDEGTRSQLDRTQDIVEEVTGERMTLMRPPYGATNGRVASMCRKLGLAQIIWDVDTMDWRDRSSSIVARRAISNSKNGSIVLFHDIHPTTVNAIPRVLKELKKKGFQFVTVSELYGRPLTAGQRYHHR